MTDVNQFIIEHLDIWTAAIEKKSSAGRGNGGGVSLHGIKKLRELILELAVHGKLVPQDNNDVPAEALLDSLRRQQADMFTKGLIKKPKPVAKITDSDVPFELPSGWKWCRISQLGHDWGQKAPDSKFTYIDVGSINKELGVVSEPTVLEASKAPSRARKLVCQGAVIYSTVRPYLLNIAVVTKDFEPEPIASTAFAIVHPFEGVSASYLYRYLRSPTFISYVKSCQTGIAYPAINDKQFFSGLVPLPPTAEQHRIVAKVDELMALCDALERQTEDTLKAHQTLVEVCLSALTNSQTPEELADNWSRLEANFDTLFTTEESIKILKEALLELAVSGRLAPQALDDEPSETLVQRVEVKRAELERSGVIKKSRQNGDLDGVQSLEALPEGWMWVPLSKLASVGTGATPLRSRSDYYTPAEISWVTSGETSQDYIRETREQISALAVNQTNVSIYPPGTLIIAMYGQGRTRGQISELKIEAGTNQACAAIQMICEDEWHKKYIKIFFQKAYHDLRAQAVGGAQPNLNVGKIAATLIPLPPLAEQRRIVDRFEELSGLLTHTAERLKSARKLQFDLADILTSKIH